MLPRLLRLKNTQNASMRPFRNVQLKGFRLRKVAIEMRSLFQSTNEKNAAVRKKHGMLLTGIKDVGDVNK